MNKIQSHSAILFLLSDFTAVIIAALLFHTARFDSWILNTPYLNLTAIGATLIVLINSRNETYRSWRGHLATHLLAKLATTWLLTGSAVAAYIIFSHQGSYFSRLWLGMWWCGSYLFALTARVLIYFFLGKLNSVSNRKTTILAIGPRETALEIEKKLKRTPWFGYQIIKTAKLNELLAYSNEVLEGALKGIDEIWITTPIQNGLQLNDISHKLGNCFLDIRYIPDIRDVRLLSHKVELLAGFHAINLSASSAVGSNTFIKRLEDLFLGSLILTLTLPFMLIIAITIKSTSKGPVLFRQKRHGMNGKTIEVYKFRTMYANVESCNLVKQATRNDLRVTPFGAFLRKTSLDELPQFFNVLQGHMSIVGPRPHAITHNEYYSDLVESYMRRHKVKPGITGWAQVNGYRGETDTINKMRKRVEYDLFYIENWSLWFDIEIIILTAISFLKHKNAY